MIYFIIGPPCSGKSTQGYLLSNKHGYPHYSIGNIMRNISKYDFSKNNILLNEKNAIKIVNNLIKQNQKNIIIDGFPRTEYQAKWLFDNIDKFKIILISVNEENEVFNRLSKRLYCPSCGNTYSKYMKNVHICEYCNFKIIKRPGDTGEITKKRIDFYYKELPSIKKICYSHLIYINGNQSIESVYRDIQNLI